eukprot:TRINITY_DN141039_c0_g1_i1.p1 TRINITY_DN141039_c0_g1~~TRINITY_DN141039_c0_g1_i1.p1  ORF type:complete len:149 (+),score=6.01 TRINITY_DN141039_c0_g1_i1:40-447(+)
MLDVPDEEDLPADASKELSAVPNPLRQLRACLSCGLIKSTAQFRLNGCEVCPFIDMKDDPARIAETTSTSFEGMIAMIDPKASWVAKWQRMRDFKHFHKGCYAISVRGELPAYVVENMARQGIRYVSRDMSKRSA